MHLRENFKQPGLTSSCRAPFIILLWIFDTITCELTDNYFSLWWILYDLEIDLKAPCT